MSKNDLYAQCVLKRKNRTMTSWLPMKFSVAGKVLKLKDENDTWEDGWIVAEVGKVLDYDSVREKERDFTKQREASDI